MMWLHRLLTKAAQWWLDEVCSGCWHRADEDGRCDACARRAAEEWFTGEQARHMDRLVRSMERETSEKRRRGFIDHTRMAVTVEPLAVYQRVINRHLTLLKALADK